MATEELLDPLEIAHQIAQALNRLNLPYFIGGSIASSLVGEYRYTNDIDFITDLTSQHVDAFLRGLAEHYYVSRDAMMRAIERNGSFNLIHIPSVQKVDIFIAGKTPFAKEQMARRRSVEVRPGINLFIASAEDIVLSKLIWFKKGGSVSDRQWGDVLGVLKVQSEKIDLHYLQQWAAQLSVLNLLEEAEKEAEIQS